MTKTAAALPLETAPASAPAAELLSNVDRLRAHLTVNDLAAALLDVWLDGPKADAQKRMTEAVNNFHTKKQTANETVAAKKD